MTARETNYANQGFLALCVDTVESPCTDGYSSDMNWGVKVALYDVCEITLELQVLTDEEKNMLFQNCW